MKINVHIGRAWTVTSNPEIRGVTHREESHIVVNPNRRILSRFDVIVGAVLPGTVLELHVTWAAMPIRVVDISETPPRWRKGFRDLDQVRESCRQFLSRVNSDFAHHEESNLLFSPNKVGDSALEITALSQKNPRFSANFSTLRPFSPQYC